MFVFVFVFVFILAHTTGRTIVERTLLHIVPIVSQLRIKHAQFNGHNYFFSWEYDLTKDLKVDWVTGRNICRRHCMDLVSIETR